MSLYHYAPISLALVRALPSSFAHALAQEAPHEPIDISLAIRQHGHYTALLRQHVKRLVELPADESCPDCCFIEDTALVVGSTVVMTRIGAPSRRNEAHRIREAFELLGAEGLPLQIEALHEPATLDGGDVLQMGGVTFVGLSQRTNEAAISQLRGILNGPVVGVPVAAGLHLKSLLSAADDQTLIVADQPAALAMGQKILAALPTQSRMVVVPDKVAANVVRLGHNLLIQEGFPRSADALAGLCQTLDLTMIPLCMSELIKADGALTCCSLLVP